MIIALIRLLNPPRATMITWTTRKSRRDPETKKCSVRADCRPPSALTAAGIAESKAGDIARPVQITSGNRKKITVRYAVRCITLYEWASVSSGGPRRRYFAKTFQKARQFLSGGAGNRFFRKWPVHRLKIA